MNTAEIFPWACSIAAVAGLLWCAIDRDRWKRRAAEEAERADKADKDADEADQESLALAAALKQVTAERDGNAEAYRLAAAERDDHGKSCDQLLQQVEKHKGETRAAKVELDAARLAGAETLSKLHVANGRILDLDARLARVVADGDRLNDLTNSLQSRVAELEIELDNTRRDLNATIERWRDDCTNTRIALASAKADVQSAVKVAEHRAGQISELGRELEVADKAKNGWRRDCENYQKLYWQVRDAMQAERKRADSEAKAVHGAGMKTYTIKPLDWQWKSTEEDGEYWRTRIVFGNIFNDGLNVQNENVFHADGRWIAGNTGKHAATAHEAKDIVESFHIATLERFLEETKAVQP